MIRTGCITDVYMSVLTSLSNDEKLDLIAKLSDSMRRKKTVSRKKKGLEIFDCFHEDWGGDASPEQIAEDLRNARTFTRTVETW